MTLADLINGNLPWWATAFAAVLLSIAAGIARRITRRSARPQGERLGELERLVLLEQTRRRQIEAVLIDDGLPLPYWAPDGPNQYRGRPRRDVDEDDRRDDRRDEPPSTALDPLPIPPLPDYPHHRR
jgi:hypothetical protein